MQEVKSKTVVDTPDTIYFSAIDKEMSYKKNPVKPGTFVVFHFDDVFKSLDEESITKLKNNEFTVKKSCSCTDYKITDTGIQFTVDIPQAPPFIKVNYEKMVSASIYLSDKCLVFEMACQVEN